MNGNIISLIQENRKLFYRGILRNTYKSDTDSPSNYIEMAKKERSSNFKEKSFRLIQEIFNE